MERPRNPGVSTHRDLREIFNKLYTLLFLVRKSRTIPVDAFVKRAVGLPALVQHLAQSCRSQPILFHRLPLTLAIDLDVWRFKLPNPNGS